MELPLISRSRNPAVSCFNSIVSAKIQLGSKLCYFPVRNKRKCFDACGVSYSNGVRMMTIRCGVESRGEGMDGGMEGETTTSGGGPFTSSTIEVTSFNQGYTEPDFPVWDKMAAVVRLSYGIGIYGVMALAGRFICSITGIDYTGGFHPSLEAIGHGLGYAVPPIMALLFILDDEVVKLSPHARAIRDVEDEELRSYFYGMSTWQFMLVVAASSVGEELFYRAAVQGALADIFLRGTDLVTDARGMAALTGVLPPFVPFAQAFAAVLTAALTGSLYYMAASPKDPKYVIAPVLRSRTGRKDLRKLFAGNVHSPMTQKPVLRQTFLMCFI